MKKVGFFLFLVFFISAIVHIPLALVVKFIPKIPDVVLANPNGTIWKGTFDVVQVQGRNLGALNFDFNFWPIFMGKLDVKLSLSGIADFAMQGNVGLGISGAYARNVELDFASSFAESFIPSPFPVNSKGMVSLNIDDYVYSLPWCKTMVGTGRWRDASVDLPFGELELGNVSANISCRANNLSVKGNSSSRALGSNISLTLSPPRTYKLEGSLTANDSLPQAIRSQLQWLGQPDEKGKYKLAFSG